jgi:hypothetical protein
MRGCGEGKLGVVNVIRGSAGNLLFFKSDNCNLIDGCRKSEETMSLFTLRATFQFIKKLTLYNAHILPPLYDI